MSTTANEPDAIARAIAETDPEEPQSLTAVELPCVVLTVLPSGDIDVQMQGGVAVDRLFVMAAILTRAANATMDANTRPNPLIVPRRLQG